MVLRGSFSSSLAWRARDWVDGRGAVGIDGWEDEFLLLRGWEDFVEIYWHAEGDEEEAPDSGFDPVLWL